MRIAIPLAVLVMWMGVREASYAGDIRADFLKLIDRPRVEAAVEMKSIPTTQPLEEFHFTYASDAKNRVPGILLKSGDATGKKPVVILLHGTGGKKEDELPLMRKLVAKGLSRWRLMGLTMGRGPRRGRGRMNIRRRFFARGTIRKSIRFSSIRFGM